MKILNPIKISYKNLMAAKWRSFLTILGIVIGVAAVIIIFSIGLSAQKLILDQIKGIGSNMIGVLPGASDDDGPPAGIFGIVTTTLTYDDLEALRNGKNVPEVEAGAGYILGTATVIYEETDLNLSYTGTTASYIDVENAEVLIGRFFSEDEETNLARVAVIGSNAASDLFVSSDPIGKKIKLGDQKFEVIGIFKERGSSSFGLASQDDSIYIPLRTAQKLIAGVNHLGFARLKIKDHQLIDSAIINTKITLRERHSIDDPTNDDFSVRDQASALNILGNITDVLRYFLLAIGVVSLIVGGIGIMNIMLIAVNQRVREVGLRKAVGAKNKDVVIQFLIESSAISFFGGIIGIIIGIIVSFLISIGAKASGFNWEFIISPWSIVVAVLAAIIIGIIFGSYPARKASKISPMEALRYE
ncbi:ABC transporter permease [Patescibacteria group bacterium]